MTADHGDFRAAAQSLLNRDEVETVLSGAFYTPADEVPLRAKTLTRPADKPLHYKVICISMYNDDLARLDDMVEKLKARGFTKANRSALIRFALAQVNLDTVPKGL